MKFELIFNEICTKILSNEEIKKQIYSLHVSNKDGCWLIQPFLSKFSFDQFTHLKSLTLIEVQQQNVELIKSILPSLSCFHLTVTEDITDEMIYLSPMIKMKTLS